MRFYEVSEIFQEIEESSSRITKTKLLADIFGRATPKEAQILSYMSLGELKPPYKEILFNLADKSLLPVIAKLLNDTQANVKKLIKKKGDVGAAVVEGNWRRSSGDEPTVTQVYNALLAIEKIGGTGSQEAKADEVYALLKSLDPDSAKYVVRIVLGKLRLGFSDMTIIDALSWMEVGDKSLRKIIEHAYNICVDIGFIVRTLKEDGIAAIEKMKIEIGIPIRPAAAERLSSAKAIIDKIGTCVAQPKLDGFRLQIHLDKTTSKPKVYFFSRNLKDMSDMFPELKKAVDDLKVKTLICEGEAIGYDANTDSFLPFQETVKRKRKHGVEKASTEFPLKLFLFDLLYLNGKPLLDEPHEDRYAKLKKLVKEDQDNALQFIEEKKVKTAKQLEDYFYKVVGEGLEGLVVKRMDAIYQPGKRNFNWIKLKRHAEGALSDTIDAVILGYYDGSGKRAGFGIGAFLVGVYNKKEDRFETIAKVGTGLTDAGWKELRKKLNKLKVGKKPSDVECVKNLYPDVWVSPEQVVELFADEVTKSPTHTAGKTDKKLGLALRFPRFLGYRDDKSPEDATTISELRKMALHD